MFNYPVNLNLSNISCLVVGAGEVGCRKASKLLKAGARKVRMIAPSLAGEDEIELEKYSAFERIEREFKEDDLAGSMLVFIATNRSDLNNKIAKLCKERGLLCNLVSNPEGGCFTVPATGRINGINVTVGTECPSLSKLICADLKDIVEKKYSEVAGLMAFARPKILALNLDKRTKKEIMISLTELCLRFNEATFLSIKAHLPSELSQEIEAKLLQAEYQK